MNPEPTKPAGPEPPPPGRIFYRVRSPAGSISVVEGGRKGMPAGAVGWCREGDAAWRGIGEDA